MQRVMVIKGIFARALRECRLGGPLSIVFMPLVARAIWLLGYGNHNSLAAHINGFMRFEPQGLGSLYRAHSLLLTGHYEEARGMLIGFLVKNPYHADACYLLAQVSTVEGHCDQKKREMAWKSLEKLSNRSRRLKTWLVLANLVENPDDFRRLEAAWLAAREAGLAPFFHPDVGHYLSIGALRAGNYDMARRIWRDIINNILEHVTTSKYSDTPNGSAFIPKRAAVALADVTNALESVAITSFLVSGTLLGCVRDGGLLAHDKDVDIGVWEDTPRQVLLDAVGSCGKFYIQPTRSRLAIRLKHVNGSSIDVFYHIREPNDYWHAGVKARWHNSPFTLTTRNFLGRDYLIPKDFNTYLQENYGDWHILKTTFDSVYDTPNAEIFDEAEMIVHDYRALSQAILQKNTEAIFRCTENLKARGELIAPVALP